MPFFDRLKCEKCYDVLHFDTTAVEERRNWAAVFSYDRLPCYSCCGILVWKCGVSSYDLLPRKSSKS